MVLLVLYNKAHLIKDPVVSGIVFSTEEACQKYIKRNFEGKFIDDIKEWELIRIEKEPLSHQGDEQRWFILETPLEEIVRKKLKKKE